MPINITMPALSPTMEEGNLSKWLVKEGDKVKSGDVIAEIETDKATMEVEAVDEGTVAKLVVPAGTEGVKVNALIAVLAADGEDVSAAASAAGSAAPAKAEAAPAPKADAAPAKAEAAPAAAPAPAAPAAVSAGGNRTFSSPLARRLAREAGIDLSNVAGSGPHGRVIKSDIEAALAGGAKPAPAPAAALASQAAAPAPAAAKGASEDAVLKLFEPGSYELVPHDGMRKTIARRLVESKQTIPHFYVSVDCELDALMALRAQLNDAAPRKDNAPAYKLSVNDMVIKAMALALRDVPDANVSWTDNNMVKHKHADVGVAVSIPGGLITPIIRKAEQKTLSVISNEMRDLGKRAKDRKLKPEEYQGGTSSVSNMGMMGVKNFAAVVNPPHATILAVGAGEQRVVVKNGEMAIATVMSVTLSTDHRCVDGALGAELLQAFKGYIENPMGMLV
ncbi:MULTISPECIES: pyruvate dehydrogenase complex dihydrolipoamide acetyltransferase [Rhizobium]|uniref:pyruvate dehydrogenase complex dihydrolipoamide acetyltransferase n=1 Tax=Rhizobium TaxID=379 RepID=UPI0007EA5A2F|nr:MULTISPECIES: pyruvate dehydrogenase complex dihydrolipoamide acetyltransferase [Rhizobium]ANK91466.1 pyruvate dehydrogenase complex dihydrolipoyllysine-residue acetyltransferase [Rhizobium sp. N6212]ANK97499.1 pyruvate dehydrogenase complex dihydrolipoyllysine-residue acetyltransferase [Rhizobium sp. N621]ANL03619.1 pyruvate dehydrogenase complex dihydrolipoyllysine-residue acetyltransferase [Rhizobium esperanzae]ANL09665.1 pyruvate dehydrogenase complex dihydrolipoyllysine-residue acetyltr